MKTIEIVSRYFLYNPNTGEKASAHGSCPPGFELRKGGYTWKVTNHRGDVTFGLCRPAAKSKIEAYEIANAIASRCGAEVK